MTGRPHVLVNMAMTADGKVDTTARQGARISSAADVRRVEELRASADAIMVGGHTLTAEDPRLTVRSPDLVDRRKREGRDPQPARIGVVSALPDPGTGADLGEASRFLHGEPARVIVFTSAVTAPSVRGWLEAGGAEVVVLGETRVDLNEAMRHLARTGIGRLLVEGGGTLVEALLREELVDEISLYVAPLLLGGRDAPTPVEGPGFAIDDAVPLLLAESIMLADGGLLLRYLVRSGVREHAGAGSAARTTTRVD